MRQEVPRLLIAWGQLYLSLHDASCLAPSVRRTTANVVFLGYDERRLGGYAGMEEAELQLGVPWRVRHARARPRLSVWWMFDVFGARVRALVHEPPHPS